MFEPDEISDNKLSIVPRKPQEGKTYICIQSILLDISRTKNIHLVLTMNVLSAGMQFFGRLLNDVGPNNIVVFNSKKQTAGECHYAKDVSGVIQLILTQNIKVIVCCAHTQRIHNSIPQLLTFAADSTYIRSTNTKFVIHIDEAHVYIPANLKQITVFNNSPIVTEIIGYSATPDGIWSANPDALFYRIRIRNVEEDLSIMRTENYFGVKDCNYSVYDSLNLTEQVNCIPTLIPTNLLCLANVEIKPKGWFGNSWHFDLGNELLLFAFFNHVLPTLQILPDQFSYHFAPAYTRKVTHYKCMELILEHYPTANVIVMNGNGSELFRCHDEKYMKIKSGEDIRQVTRTMTNEIAMKKELELLNEPSYMVQQLIQNTPNYPTFITGFTCVGMSVTLINPNIGNFDNVIMSHEHYCSDKLYQLCRFLFNYDKWSSDKKSTIKKTHFHSYKQSVIDTCLGYEQHVENMASSEFAGKMCSLSEIRGMEPEEPTQREIQKQEFAAIRLENPIQCKKIRVEEGNDEEKWEEAMQFYKNIVKKDLHGKSKPKKNENGFYETSDTKKLDVQTTVTYNCLKKEKWNSRFILKKDCLSYARVFVGYDDLEDPSEYTIFIKYAQLVDTPATRDYLAKYHDKKPNQDENS